MNITFCVSSMPNQRMVSGISAATGRLRPKSASGAPDASMTRHDPATMPSGTPTRTARPKPIRTRFSVAAMLCSSARSLSRLGKLAITSPGLGRITGEIRRSSGAPAGRQPPEQHDKCHQARAEQPPRDLRRRCTKREQRRSGVAPHLLGGASLRRVDLDLDAPVLGVVLRIRRVGRPIPADARPWRTGSAAATGTCAGSLP